MKNNNNFRELINNAIDLANNNISFFEDKDKGSVDFFMPESGTDHKIVDVAYITPKDEDSNEYAVVAYVDEDGSEKFIYVNREARKFVKNIVAIADANDMDTRELLANSGVTMYITKVMKRGHEGEEMTVVDGEANWFYKYEISC